MPGKTPRKDSKASDHGRKASKDDSKKSKSKKPVKDVDEEMTVVVPPSKAPKQASAPPPADDDGDVSMGGDEDKNEDGSVKVDPVAQTVSGKLNRSTKSCLLFADTFQTSRATSHY